MSEAAQQPPPVDTPTEDDAAPLLDTMLSGFAVDPLYVWLYPDPAQRRASLGATFELMLQRGLERGHVRCTGDRRALAIWTPPGTDLLDASDLDGWLHRLRLEAPSRVEPAVAAMAACASRAPGRPHWVLHSVVVASDRQGRGLGSAVLRSTLVDIDRSPAPAHLESSNPRNVSAYRRLGFEVVAEVAIPEGPTMRPMTRPGPRSTGPSSEHRPAP